MLLIISAILIVMWLLGFAFHIGGALIHILLVIALVVAIFHIILTSSRNKYDRW